LAYEYRQEDFVREAPEVIDNDEIDRQVSKFFTIKKTTKKSHPQRAFGLMKLPLEVRNFE